MSFRTRNHYEFPAVQGGTLLHAEMLVEQAGTGFAFPSGTVYPGREGGLDMERQQAAGKQAR